jgi:tetrahydromethanopterin S-methyltransferase subunit G
MNKKENRKFKYRVWEEGKITYGEIRFFGPDEDKLCFNFRNSLIENIKNTNKLELLKYEGAPTEFDSSYLLFKNEVVSEGQTLLKKFKEENNQDTWKVIKNLSTFQVGTSHDYPYVDCWSKIHSKSELIEEIQKAAQILNIKLEWLDLEEQREIQTRVEKTIGKILLGIFIAIFLILIIISIIG